MIKRRDTSTDPAPAGDRKGMTMGGWLTIGACVLYILSPIDIAPEAILGPLGVPDDILAALVAGKVIFSARRRTSARGDG